MLPCSRTFAEEKCMTVIKSMSLFNSYKIECNLWCRFVDRKEQNRKNPNDVGKENAEKVCGPVYVSSFWGE
jgi:hypothetical protein